MRRQGLVRLVRAELQAVKERAAPELHRRGLPAVAAHLQRRQIVEQRAGRRTERHLCGRTAGVARLAAGIIVEESDEICAQGGGGGKGQGG